MNKWHKFYLLASAHIILMALDAGLTYLAASDLSLEGNPLILFAEHRWGLGWVAVAVLNVPAVTIFVVFAYHHCIKREYVRSCLYPKSFFHFYRLTKRKENRNITKAASSFLVHLVYLFMRGTVVLDWIIIHISLALSWQVAEGNFFAFTPTTPLWFIDFRAITYFNYLGLLLPDSIMRNIIFPANMLNLVLFGFILIHIATFFWYLREYRIQKRLMQSQEAL